MKRRLLLFDLGYFEYSLFERIQRNGGYFISRLKAYANPKILFSHRSHKGRKKPIEAQKLKSVLARLYVTNVASEQMTPEDIAKTYAARWEVELIFKELKSYYRIDQLPSASQHVVESLIYTAILTLVVSRALLFELRRIKKLSANEAPVRRWVAVFHSIVQRFFYSSIIVGKTKRCG
ncbi:MAG: transposase [Vulcanimicrobiota bacterium]